MCIDTEVQAARALQLARQHEIRVGEAGRAAPGQRESRGLRGLWSDSEEWSELLKVPSNRTPDALLGQGWGMPQDARMPQELTWHL